MHSPDIFQNRKILDVAREVVKNHNRQVEEMLKEYFEKHPENIGKPLERIVQGDVTKYVVGDELVLKVTGPCKEDSNLRIDYKVYY